MGSKLRALIVEDEPLAARRMVRLLSSFPEVELVGIAENGREALLIIESARPTLLLLDIEMPELSGFELLECLPPDAAPAVIFTTAFHHYAARAFSVSAADYLVKPATRESLGRALRRAQRNLTANKAEERLRQLQQLVAELRGQLRKTELSDDDLWVRHMGELIRIPLATVDWFEAEKDYVRIHSNGRSYLIHGMIGALNQRLDSGQFMRVHRSAIVRLDCIKSIRRRRDGSTSIELANETVIRVGRTYNAALRAALTLRPSAGVF